MEDTSVAHQSVEIDEIPRRQLNDQEVQMLVAEWRRFRSEIRDPLHVWLGWTEVELERWRQLGELPA